MLSQFTSVLLLAAPAFAALQDPGSWTRVGAAPAIPSGVISPQIEFDPEGTPYVAFQDQSGGYKRTSVVTLIGGDWKFVGPPGGASVQTAWYNRMAFDNQARPYVVSRDYGVASQANVRRYEATTNSWVNVGSPGISGDEAHYTDIAFGPGNEPWVAYTDRSTTPIDQVTVRRFHQGTWEVVGRKGLSGRAAAYTTIDFDPGGVPYVAYVDALYNGRVTVLRYDAATGVWGAVGAPGFGDPLVSNSAIAIDGTGTPFVATLRHQYQVVVRRFDGTNWVVVGNGPATAGDLPTLESEGWRQWLSLTFDRLDRPYVGYQRLVDFKAVVRYLNGNQWSSLGSLDDPLGADYMTMAVDPSGAPWIAYRDGPYGHSFDVQRFVRAPRTYCETTTGGCEPIIAFAGEASFTSTAPFLITAENMPGGRPGLFFYGFERASTPFGSGLLCVALPAVRSNILTSPPASGCGSQLTIDFNRLLTGQFAPFDTVRGQFWFRQPSDPAGFATTDAIEFTLLP